MNDCRNYGGARYKFCHYNGTINARINNLNTTKRFRRTLLLLLLFNVDVSRELSVSYNKISTQFFSYKQLFNRWHFLIITGRYLEPSRMRRWKYTRVQISKTSSDTRPPIVLNFKSIHHINPWNLRIDHPLLSIRITARRFDRPAAIIISLSADKRRSRSTWRDLRRGMRTAWAFWFKFQHAKDALHAARCVYAVMLKCAHYCDNGCGAVFSNRRWILAGFRVIV